MRRGEVWWVEFDPAVGSEIRKTRPAVIVSNDAANRNLSRVVVVPVTSNTGRQYPGEAVVTVDGQSSKAMVDQIMAAEHEAAQPPWNLTTSGTISSATMLMILINGLMAGPAVSL